MIVYKADRISNSENSKWLDNHAVLVSGSIIKDILPISELPNDVSNKMEIYDLGNIFLLPGIIDAHCHMHCSATSNAQELAYNESDSQLIIRAVNNMRKCVLSGTTTVRDLGSKNNIAFPVKQMIDDNNIPGPDLILSGAPITITAGHCWIFGTEADSKDEVIKAVRKQVKAGANVIKIMATGGMFTPTSNPRRTQYSVEILKEVVLEAKRFNIPVAAHTLSADGVEDCVEAKVDHLIHARWYDKNPKKGIDFRKEIVKKMVDQEQWVDPTLGHQLLRKDVNVDPINSSAHDGQDKNMKSHWAIGKDVPMEEHLEKLLIMENLGVRFTTGLDMGMAFGNHDKSTANAWSLVELLGWDNWKAIKASTSDTAEALGFGEKIGRIKKNFTANFAAFSNDPAKNIRNLSDASSVIKNGKPIKINNNVLI